MIKICTNARRPSDKIIIGVDIDGKIHFESITLVPDRVSNQVRLEYRSASEISTARGGVLAGGATGGPLMLRT
jgi:hypothetical protein